MCRSPWLPPQRRADLAHVQVKRHERRVVRGGQAAEGGRRGEHGLVAAGPQPQRERDERLDVALRPDREQQRFHRPPSPENPRPRIT